MNSRLAQAMQWIDINGEELRRRSLDREREAQAKYLKARFSDDPEYQKLIGWRHRFTSMLMKERRPSETRRNTNACQRLCGCSWQEMRDQIEAKFYDGMRWSDYGPKTSNWVLDHIKPICLFDWWTHEGRRKAFHHQNVQPLWYKDHKIKCVEDRALARLRALNDSTYAARVQKWRVLDPAAQELTWEDIEAEAEKLLTSPLKVDPFRDSP